MNQSGGSDPGLTLLTNPFPNPEHSPKQTGGICMDLSIWGAWGRMGADSLKETVTLQEHHRSGHASMQSPTVLSSGFPRNALP